MCGIAGVCNVNAEPVSAGLLRKMTDVIAHRGPDGEGHFVEGAIGLGHRRLAIIDLSPTGHQPMANETGDIVIVYNGEIYNFQTLRLELESTGHRFHSRSDTETIIHGYEEWGADVVARLNGMFAFAIWDRVKKQLFIARDRYGIKPLYWYYEGGVFLFASEIKAILEHPRVQRAVCYPALDEYFTFQNVFSDLTLFEGIRLLPPASTLTLDARDPDARPQVRRYWDYGFDAQLNLTEEECTEQLHHLFVQAVTRQLISDVPVASYLSGGMDSGSIVSVAARHLPRMMTFTGGFDLTSASGLELGFDERRAAEALSNLFKTEHYQVVMHAGDMEAVLPDLIWHQEDLRVGQCYPNFYVARLAGKFVKVVLSGAGGDELFAGYPWRYYRGLNSGTAEGYIRHYYDFWQRLIPDEGKARFFNADTRRAIGDHSAFAAFQQVFGGYPGKFENRDDYVNAALYFELKTFLHGLLVVEDKLSMAHSLETRVPFLDNDLVDFALRIPAHYKLSNLDRFVAMDENEQSKRQLYERQTSDGKAILRRAMSPLIPLETLERAKQGFSAPDATWFRGESIDYINRLLRDRKARLYEYLQYESIGAALDEHCAGKVNRRLLIWSLLSFEWWLRKFF